MRVLVTNPIKASFTSVNEQQEFVSNFRAWKTAEDPCSFLFFGKNVSTTVPIGNDFDTLWHVHLPPSENKSLKRWQDFFNSKSHHARCNRTSDLLLFYADWKSNFILLAVDNHRLMNPPLDKLNALCESANHGVQWLMKNPPT